MRHSGSDGGRIRDIILWSSYRSLGLSFQCNVGIKLNNDEFAIVACKKTKAEPYKYLNRTCNGNERFCKMKFNEFTFPGTHNSGTGIEIEIHLSPEKFDCHFKNHDLTVTEMLDFGIRFFDFDTNYK